MARIREGLPLEKRGDKGERAEKQAEAIVGAAIASRGERERVESEEPREGKPAGMKLQLALFSSLFLNAYFYFCLFLHHHQPPPSLGWAGSAAAEAEAVAAIDCSGHGRAFLDGVLAGGGLPVCYDCSRLLHDCPADVDSGDPLFLEAYWQQQAASSAVVVSGWHRMTYSTNGKDYISIELEKHIRILHQAVGNAVTDGKFIVFGSGSAQLINALVYALSPSNASSSPASVVASAPYYPFYKKQTNLFETREYGWGGTTATWANASVSSATNVIEFVTSPNNPDGLFKQPVLGTSAVIFDYAYYWPHYSPILDPADEDVMLFTNSKISGHAGSRWAVIKDEGVYERTAKYLSLNTMGVSRDTHLRVLKLIKRRREEKGTSSSSVLRAKARWSKLHELASSSSRFSLQHSAQHRNYFERSETLLPYAWLKCEWKEDEDCHEALRKGSIISRAGALFEADSRYTRLSLIKTQDDFDLFLKRMQPLVSREEMASS
ncbi:tryptophan aminotransferase-related protein 4-like [Musa troglodytarum]|uniref:Tryptophan aminotransferase-related protein 4-like n=1 Tax=Musa troglodytarum TaxID=320322 RepID=A0A9E7FGV5_9LILI|nr:tryptophan aminotransferase-related protein 4-like [Musa troglodytarum]